MKRIGLILLSFLLLSSCVEDLELDIPQHQPRLVVGGLMQDSIVEVFVGQSFPSSPEGYNGLPNCEVFISGANLPKTQLNNIPETGYYDVSLVLQNKKSFKLEVSHPNFLKVFSEEVHVERPQILDFELEKLGEPDSIYPGLFVQSFEVSTEVSIPDSDFGGLAFKTYLTLKDDLGRPQTFQPGNIVIAGDVPFEYFRNQGVAFIEKENFKKLGGKLKMAFTLTLSDRIQFEGRAFLEVSTISSSYQKFLQAYYIQERTDLEAIFTEPQYLFSNITNGHGYFGSQAKDSLSKVIR